MFKPLLLLLLLFSSVEAFACSCSGPGPPDMSYASAGAVFAARISALKNGGFHLTRGKSWKGDAPEEFVLPLRGCSMENVQSGAEYIVYASVIGDTKDLHVGLCSRKTLLQQSPIEAQYLDALKAGSKLDLAAGLPASLTAAADATVRAEAARLMSELMQYDRNATVFEPAILQGTKDRNAEVRAAAVRALGGIRTRGAADARIVALTDPDRAVRAAAVAGSSRMKGEGALFRALVTALQRAHANPDPDEDAQESLLHEFAQQFASAAVTEADKDEAAQLLQGLIAEIKEPWKRVLPVQQLGMMGARARGAAPQLLQVLQTSDYYNLKQYTIIALADIGAVEMQVEIEPYLKDKDCYVVQAVVQAVAKLNKEGFDRFFVEKGMPEMKSRFDRCAFQFITALQGVAPAGREMESFVASRYATMADADGTKETVKRLLETWQGAR